MSSTTSVDIPLIIQSTSNSYPPDYVTIINPDGSISYETNVHYQQPTIIRRSYRTPPKSRYQYKIEQVFILFKIFVIINFVYVLLLNRREKPIVVVNVVDIGVHVIVQYLIFVIV